jgi:acyl transferase domain-containing protein
MECISNNFSYCSGAISKESAWKIAYYRGLLSAKMQEAGRPRGAMLAVLLSEAKILPYLEAVERVHNGSGLQIACYNSQENLTISGDEGHIDTLQSVLTEAGHRWHRLKVDVAYHSTHMTTISDEFLSLISGIEGSTDSKEKCSNLIVSTLTGTLVTADELLDPKYWVRNLVSPVRFQQAISQLCKPPVANNRVLKLDLSHRKDCSVDFLVEVGPHSALQGPIRSVLQACSNTTSEYISVLQRNRNGLSTVLSAAGKLFCVGYPIDLAQVNRLTEKKYLSLFSGLPQYPFNHSREYWHESRLSSGTRFATHGKHELLGKPVADWNPLDARWRRFLNTADVPWLEDHKVIYFFLCLVKIYIQKLIEKGPKPGLDARCRHANHGDRSHKTTSE